MEKDYNLIRKVPNDWIHWIQILSLVLLGLAIWFQTSLTKFGLGHRTAMIIVLTAMIIVFLGLLISLGVEHK